MIDDKNVSGRFFFTRSLLDFHSLLRFAISLAGAGR